MYKRSLRMFAISLFLAFVSANVSADTCKPYNPDAPYRLVFEDNFDGGALNRELWNTEFLWGPSVVINNETQYYVSEGQFGYNPFKFNDGVLSIEAIKTPYEPDQLYLTRYIFSANYIRLLWKRPVGAVRFEIYRDGELQRVTRGLSFLQSELRDGIDYGYEVRAFDRAGEQIVAAQITINTSDRLFAGGGGSGLPPNPEFTLKLESRIYSPTSGELIWRAPNRSGSFEIYRNGRPYRKLEGANHQSVYEDNLIEGANYVYRVIAYDKCGEKIIQQNVNLNTLKGDTARVTKVERLVIQTKIYSKSDAELIWNAVEGAVNYDVLQDGEFIENIDGRSYFASGLVPGIDSKFRVIAYDANGEIVDQTTRVVNLADNSVALNRQPYLSGMISSYDSFKFKYGRVEARARMPAGKGLWSAFFLFNAYYGEDQPEDPEIDIMEGIGDRLTTANNAYWYKKDLDGDGFYTDLDRTEFRSPMEDFSTDFRVYRVDWEPNLLVYYVDDVETGRVEGSQVSDEQMYVLASLAVGGGFPGPADETTPFPARYEIDYIRVYQRY